MSAPSPIKIGKINYRGWPNSYRMSNGEVELVVTADVGPRIIRYADRVFYLEDGRLQDGEDDPHGPEFNGRVSSHGSKMTR